MNIKIFINPEYSYLNDYILRIPEVFEKTGDSLHSGRNIVKEVTVKDTRLVIKYFKQITWVNRIIFATLRKSKAVRTYENSIKLLQKGINTPDPVAYIDCYKGGLLYKSYYVSLFTDYQPLSDLFLLPLNESEKALRSFARFSYRLHKLEIYHDDYSLRNVLYKVNGQDYNFSLIDNNRMRFCNNTSYRKKLKNLERINLPAEKMGIVGSEYAREAQLDDIKTLDIMTSYRLKFLSKAEAKKRLKRVFPGYKKKDSVPVKR